MQILGLLKADKDSEAAVPPSPELMERMGNFIGEVMQAGVLAATDGLQPSSKGKRVRLSKGKVTVADGPFTESKELIASYTLFDVKHRSCATPANADCSSSAPPRARPSDVVVPGCEAGNQTIRTGFPRRLAVVRSAK